MKIPLPLLLAHGEGLITMMFVVLPAALAGAGLLIASFTSYCRSKEGYKRRVLIFGAIGVSLLVLAYVAMRVGTGITRII